MRERPSTPRLRPSTPGLRPSAQGARASARDERATTRRVPLGAVLALALAGCPLPQPLTEVANSSNGQTVTPPRIVAGSVAPADAVVHVATNCPTPPRFTLKATVHDDDPLEQVDARWFVDYAPDPYNARPYHSDVLAPPEDPSLLDRPVPPLSLVFPVPDGARVHVIELVVSNGFYVLDDATAPVPNRSAQPGYETQVYRWVFEYVDAGGVCQL